MIWKIRFGRWRATFSLAPVTDIIGVNSQLPNGQHILMWDFDDSPLSTVQRNLLWTQRKHALPNIYILQSSSSNKHIAYCFCAVDFVEAIHIISGTKGVDRNFIKYGDYRERFTLRVSPKNSRRPKLVSTLKSNVPEDVTIADLKSWTQYETTDWDNPSLKKYLKYNNILGHRRTLNMRARGWDAER